MYVGQVLFDFKNHQIAPKLLGPTSKGLELVEVSESLPLHFDKGMTRFGSNVRLWSKVNPK